MVKIVINPYFKEEIEPFIEQLPTIFEQEGETLENSRNTIKVFKYQDLSINVKSFKKPHFINQFVYATFRSSKAKRSFQYATRLEEAGINTPTPLAYMETKKCILLKQSAFLSKQIEVDGVLRILNTGSVEGHYDLIVAFAKYTANLHDKQILHLDYSSGNILYKKENDEYIFYLVDLNRIKFDKDISMDEACHNFRRLWGSDEMLKLFAKEYAKARNFDTEETIKKTMEYRVQFWKSFNKRYPGVKPYYA